MINISNLLWSFLIYCYSYFVLILANGWTCNQCKPPQVFQSQLQLTSHYVHRGIAYKVNKIKALL